MRIDVAEIVKPTMSPGLVNLILIAENAAEDLQIKSIESQFRQYRIRCGEFSDTSNNAKGIIAEIDTYLGLGIDMHEIRKELEKDPPKRRGLKAS